MTTSVRVDGALPAAKGVKGEGGAYVIGLMSGLLVSTSALKATPMLGWIPFDPIVAILLVALALIAVSARPFRPDIAVAVPSALFFLCMLPGVILASDQYKLVEIFILTPLLLLLGWSSAFSRTGSRGFADGNIILAILVVAGLFFFPEMFGVDGRIVVYGSNPIDITRAMTFGVICVLYRYGQGNRTVAAKIFWLVIAASFIVGALQPGSRGPWVALAVSIVLMVLLSRGRWYLIWIVCSLGVSSVFARSIGWTWDPIEAPLLNRFGETFEAGDFTTGRDVLADLAVQGIKYNPFGVGWGSFENYAVLHGFSGVNYPHNIILEIGVEGGWIALFGLVVLMIGVVAYSVRAGRYVDSNFAIVAFSYWFVAALFSSDFGGNRGVWLSVGLGAGACMFVRERQRGSTTFHGQSA